jgi:hypothetical protein
VRSLFGAPIGSEREGTVPLGDRKAPLWGRYNPRASPAPPPRGKVPSPLGIVRTLLRDSCVPEGEATVPRGDACFPKEGAYIKLLNPYRYRVRQRVHLAGAIGSREGPNGEGIRPTRPLVRPRAHVGGANAHPPRPCAHFEGPRDPRLALPWVTKCQGRRIYLSAWHPVSPPPTARPPTSSSGETRIRAFLSGASRRRCRSWAGKRGSADSGLKAGGRIARLERWGERCVRRYELAENS